MHLHFSELVVFLALLYIYNNQKLSEYPSQCDTHLLAVHFIYRSFTIGELPKLCVKIHPDS